MGSFMIALTVFGIFCLGLLTVFSFIVAIEPSTPALARLIFPATLFVFIWAIVAVTG